MDLASAGWTDLQQRFSQNDIYQIADLQEQLYALKQGELTVTSYFTQLKSVWDELEMFRPVGRCQSFVPCSCATYRAQDYVIRFLHGLIEQYAGPRSQIMLLDPLPDIN